MTKYKQTEITVQGKSSFPVDMLRYDRCFPATESDAHAVLAVIDGDRIPFQIKLIRVSELGAKATVGRWRSFGWDVIQDTGKDPK